MYVIQFTTEYRVQVRREKREREREGKENR